MKVIVLSQEDANDLLGMICNDQVVIATSRAARVHQLQALLSSEPVDMIPAPRDEIIEKRVHTLGTAERIA